MVTKGGRKLTLDGGDSGATGNDLGEDVALHGDTEGKGNNVEQEHVGGVGRGGLSGEDTGLNGGTVGNSLIGVDALLELLAAEEVAEELLDLGDTGRATNEDDLVNLRLLNLSVLDDLLNGLDGALESLVVDVLETSTGDLGVEVLAIEERVDLDGGLGTVGESTLGTLASGSQAAEGTGVLGDVLLGLLRTLLASDSEIYKSGNSAYLALELLLEVLKEVGVEVLAT